MKSTNAVAAAALGCVLASTAQAALVEKWYNIQQVTTNPDGMFDKVAVGVNGTWPPPILEVHQNDTVRIHVTNQLGPRTTTSVHHHGLFFRNEDLSPIGYYDGAPGITQCGIPPNQTLTYEVPVWEDGNQGTFWWHSHNGDQYMDGMRAPFIIHRAQEVHQYDEEYTIILGDWYHKPAAEMNKRFMSKYNPTGAEPVPESLLMYFAANGSYLPSNDNVAFNENAGISFEPGKTYRLRVINTGAFAMQFLWIEGHQMRVIEVDGTDIEEFPVDYLTLSVAQRYSVLVTARNDTSSNWAIHADFDDSMFDTVPEGLKLNYTSTISYGEGLPLQDKGYLETRGLMEDHLMVPTTVQAQLTPTRHIELGVLFDTYSDGSNRASFNNITFTAPKTPTLFTELSMGTDALSTEVYGPQTHAYVLNKGDIVDLMVVNYDGNAHPFHLHGHKVQITRVATNVSSDDPTVNPPHTLGAANPLRRDVFIVPGDGGAVNVAFEADNAGVWIFHCHIDWHMTAGLAAVFIEAPSEAQQTMQIPQVMKDQCASLDIAAEGNAAGRMSATDLKGAPYGPFPQTSGWTPRAKGALAGTILAALLGMAAVVWYAMGGALDEDELQQEVEREVAIKQAKKEAGKGSLVQRGVKALRR